MTVGTSALGGAGIGSTERGFDSAGAFGAFNGAVFLISPETVIAVFAPASILLFVSRQKTNAMRDPPSENVYARVAIPSFTVISPISARSTQRVQR